MNERLIELIIGCGTMHLGDNPSRHSPIVLKLNLDNIPLKAEVNANVSRKPTWYKATEQEINKYTLDLHCKLSSLEPPACLDCKDMLCHDESHSQDRDSHVLDILIAVIETSYTCIPLSGCVKNKVSNPQSTCLINQFLAGKTKLNL